MSRNNLLIAFIAASLLAGCLPQGGGTKSTTGPTEASQPVTPPAGDPPADNNGDGGTVINDPAPTSGTAEPEPLSFASLSGKTLLRGSDRIEIQSGKVIDTRCGAEYTIASQSSDNGTVTIETDVIPSTYQVPSTLDCYVPTNGLIKSIIVNWTTMACVTATISDEIAWQIKYKITEHGSGFSVERFLRSRIFVSSCPNKHLTQLYERVESSMPAEVYDAN